MHDDPQHVCSATAFEHFPDDALDSSIVDRFELQVERHRRCLALVEGDTRLTYGELDARANAVAHALVDRLGVGAAPVALVVEQGAAYAAAVLGTLKSGRPDVPLEPSDPVPRLGALVDECDASILLCDAASRAVADAAAGGLPLVDVDELVPRPERTGVEVDPDSVAYVFFTSGSTGAPKGVFDSHRNVLHNVLRYTNALRIAPADRLTLLQGPAFSGCVSSQFGALLNGAASFPFRLADEGLLRAADWLERERITIYHSVPSVFRAVVGRGGDFSAIRVVRLEGDRASSEDADLWKRHFTADCVLANGLGTTETGLACQLVLRYTDTAPRGALPVGYPVRDMTVLVVGDDRRPVAAGAAGEIAVASDYLALGYWKRPDLTAERFEHRGPTRLYYTGDLGRLAADGSLEYLGRRDGDVKVLGARVEPAEVERELLRIDGVRHAAVVVREGRDGRGQVVAYVVPRAVGELDLHFLRSALSVRLPSVMLPIALVELESLPLGLNGKVDRRALPDPPETRSEIPPVGETEQWLADIWSDVLALDRVGADDDFFALGGDSLAAAEIVAQVEERTGRRLALGALVRAPTVAALAQLLTEPSRARRSSLTVLRPGDDLPPLVLVHGNTGNALHYSGLVAALAGDRPLLALEYLEAESDLSIDGMVEAHLETLAEAQVDDECLLVGFCYGGVVAHELGVRLAQRGHEVAVALLGITPLEFPTVVSDAAKARWRQAHPAPTVASRVRRHAAIANRLHLRDALRYVARRSRSVAARAWRRARGRPSTAAGVAQAALESHRPLPFPGRPLVVLHDADAAEYTARPAVEWDALGTEGVDVLLLPGSDHAMLEGRGAEALAAVLETWAGSRTPSRL
jgi:amino acid adenylation domain-containing protein